jgi:hypothetical protein
MDNTSDVLTDPGVLCRISCMYHMAGPLHLLCAQLGDAQYFESIAHSDVNCQIQTFPRSHAQAAFHY